jgi:hypothetical protein
VRLIEDEDPVQELTAQGTDQALADRVHPRRLNGGAQDSGAGGLEDGVEGRGEARPAVVCVPKTSSTSCDQPIFVDQATDMSLFSDAVQVEVDRLG